MNSTKITIDTSKGVSSPGSFKSGDRMLGTLDAIIMSKSTRSREQAYIDHSRMNGHMSQEQWSERFDWLSDPSAWSDTWIQPADFVEFMKRLDGIKIVVK